MVTFYFGRKIPINGKFHLGTTGTRTSCRPTVGTTAGRKSKTGFDWSWIQPIRRYKGKLPEHAFMSGII
jgi:hypothetical protein